ncbi:MAG: DUF4276 family protein [Desulfovibrionaceae bacterium]
MKIKVYVEGGGQNKALKIKLRQGFSSFFKKAGIKVNPIRCGGRSETYRAFCGAVKHPEKDTLPILLVDSEAPVSEKHSEIPWEHLRLRDKWTKPKGSTDDQAHLMVECMEAWFMADKNALAEFFGQGFHLNSLPPRADIEAIPKATLYSSLENAAKPTKKKTYGKGDHSFGILEMIDPQKVQDASPWAKRLIDTLTQKL